MIRTGAAAALCALLLSAGANARELPVDGITIGGSIIALARSLGTPASVASGDSGHRFAFGGDVAAYTDDDGIVLAVDARAGVPRIDVDGIARTFPIGSYSTARADAELADVAEFATPALRSYRLAPRRDLVLTFAGSANRLVRLAYGEPGQLARLGLLPGDAASRAVIYRAPQLRAPAANSARPGWARTIADSPATDADTLGPASGASGSGGRVTSGVFRVAVDRAGRVRDVEIVLSSGSPAQDARQAQSLVSDRYAPASLDGRAIAAAVFVELPR